MTIFKACLKILNKNKLLMCIYFAIFTVLSFSLFKSRTSEDLSYDAETVKVSVINEDNGEYAESLVKFLEDNCKITEIVESDEGIADALFYRYTEYVVRIPEGFSEAMEQNGSVSIDKYEVAGSYSAVLVDNMINVYVAKMKLYGADVPVNSTETAVYSSSSNQDESNAVFVFNFMAYADMAIIILGLGAIIAAFNNRDMKMRNAVSPVSSVKIGIYQMLCCLLFTLAVWVLFIAVMLIYLKDEGVTTASLYMMLNILALSLSVFALGFFVNTVVKSLNGRIIAANVISLGFSFTGGVMVSLELLSDKVKIMGSFTPVYWYVSANEMINELESFTFESMSEIYRNMGIEMLFAVAFIAAGLAARKLDS